MDMEWLFWSGTDFSLSLLAVFVSVKLIVTVKPILLWGGKGVQLHFDHACWRRLSPQTYIHITQ